MRKLIIATATAAIALSTVAAGPQASQSPPDGYEAEFELKKGEAFTFEGAQDTGGITGPFGADNGEYCSGEVGVGGKCDFILVNAKGSGLVSFVLEASFNPADYDIRFYESDESGSIGEEVASSGTLYGPVEDETIISLAPVESGEFEAKRGYYAILVDYYAAGGGYTLDVSMS